jgi:hypothetical protein
MDEEFLNFVKIIDEGFFPKNVKNETDAEKELVDFLNCSFPGMVIYPGHTSKGSRIDIVIYGTYAVEVVLVDGESRLITFMHQIIDVKEDFSDTLAILIDVGKVSSELVQKYASSCEKIEIATIIKNF